MKNKSSLRQASLVALMSAAFVSVGAQTTSSSSTKASGARMSQTTKTDTSQSAGAKSGTSSKTTDASASGTPAATVLVLMPVAMTTDNQLGKGCWVRFYDNKNFRGANLTLVGPVDMPSMDVPGSAWREWDSAIVGPKARVTTYDNENYNDRTATLNASQRIPDLGDSKLGWFEEVHSAKVSCSA